MSLTDFSKCSKSHNFASIGSMHNFYMCLNVELLNERMHATIKVNLTEKS